MQSGLPSNFASRRHFLMQAYTEAPVTPVPFFGECGCVQGTTRSNIPDSQVSGVPRHPRATVQCVHRFPPPREPSPKELGGGLAMLDASLRCCG